MKTIEEKARAYDEALKVLHKYDGANIMFSQSLKEEMFPELKESEEGKIRKKLITFFQRFPYTNLYDVSLNAKDVIAWLEKQGEQKFTDKAEPKFKVGDWITNGIETIQITGYDIDYGYQVDYKGNLQHRDTDIIEKEYHLWNINDAKDGDVLFHSDSASNGIFIFKELLKYEFSEKVICYCDYDSEDHFCLGEHHTCCWSDAKILHPATKEQRALLFQKMKEAGYEWDSEKIELKKIHVIDEGKAEMDYCFTKMMNGEKVSPAWSEEDENMLTDTEYLMRVVKMENRSDNEYQRAENCINWLKSLRDKVQPKREWSKEDERCLTNAIYACMEVSDEDYDYSQSYIDAINWLKSIKNRVSSEPACNKEMENTKSYMA